MPVTGTREETPLCPGCERESALEIERDRLAAENARLKTDQHDALRLAAEAYLDARDAIDPPRETATRRQLEAVLGRAPASSRGGVSAARQFGLGGGSGTRSGEV